MQFTAADETVPVLIVGGGGAGLTASMLLARQGVEHLLVSARATTSDLPEAHVLNQRAMEVLDDVGVAEAIAQRSTPAEQMAATAFYAGLTGPDPDYGRRLARLESWGCGEDDESWHAASAWRQMNLPQIRLEPWYEAARQLAADAGIPLDAVRIGHLDGDLYDPRCAWLRQREIQSDGAILVRPDRFVAWRQATSAENPQSALARVLSQILARPIEAPVPAGATA